MGARVQGGRLHMDRTAPGRQWPVSLSVRHAEVWGDGGPFPSTVKPAHSLP